LGPGTDFGKWLTEILSSQKTCAEVPCETYINILKVLFFTMYAQRDIVTNSDLLRHSEKTTEIVGSPENILFLTKEQRNVLTDPSKTRVAFLSAFGTGKTTLLFHKAKQLLEENCDVRIVIINKVQDSQLMQKYRQLLNKHTKGICTVITGTTFGLHIYTCLYLLQI
jgi:superfamily I DNA and RNA helicase